MEQTDYRPIHQLAGPLLRQRGRLTDKDAIAPHHWPQPLHVERYAGIVGCAAAAEKKMAKKISVRCLSFTVLPPENLPTQTSPLPSRTLFLRPPKVHFALWSYERRFIKRFIDFSLFSSLSDTHSIRHNVWHFWSCLWPRGPAWRDLDSRLHGLPCLCKY